jgi:hypothetical protein
VVGRTVKEFEKLPFVSIARDWLNAKDVMFWMLENERVCFQETILEPSEVWISEDTDRLRFAKSEK